MNTNTNETQQGVYLGDRGQDFKRLITRLLNKGGLRQKYIDILTDEQSLREYESAFTSELIDEEHNYQVYEQLGDLSGNKFIVWYFYRRFPQLRCADGVKIVARLRINYGAKESFCKIAEEQGFWDFISAPNDIRNRKRQSLLEDAFEAFIGVTEWLVDSRVKQNVGYSCVYKIMKSIFDDMPISLAYEDLYDAKTRLKELFDMHSDLGKLSYREDKDETMTHSTALRNGRPIGRGSASLKPDAQQMAAQQALETLAGQGFVKHPPRIYAQVSAGEKPSDPEVTEQIIQRICPEGINALCPTRSKVRYQSRYMSTVLGLYCRKGNVDAIELCLKMGADINIPDSEGMTCMDLLLMNSPSEQTIKKVFKLFKIQIRSEKGKKIDIHSNVKKAYYDKLTDAWFTSRTKYFNVLP